MQMTGRAEPLTEQGVRAAADIIATGAAELWAVLTVETAGCGFLPDRRPDILFERHEFRRRTNGRFDAAYPDISGPQGGYGRPGAHQYDRLARAMSCDPDAALESASWGLGQIMGYNARAAGFTSAAEMCAAMIEAEDAQLIGAARFMRSENMHVFLQRHDWSGFARRYNGAGYAQNAYDTKLAQAHARFAASGTPDLRFRAVQLLLTYRGCNVGAIDGLPGPRSLAAIRAFRVQSGLPAEGGVDDALLQALHTHSSVSPAPERPIDTAFVQRLLTACGLEGVAADGIAGPRTRDAIRAFRLRCGLPGSDAIDGALLCALFDAVTARSATSASVLLVQTMLAQAGFDPGQRDGRWGPHTASAMRAAGIASERLDPQAMRAFLAWARSSAPASAPEVVS